MTKSISKICCIIKSGFISELNKYSRWDLIIEAYIIGVIEMTAVKVEGQKSCQLSQTTGTSNVRVPQFCPISYKVT